MDFTLELLVRDGKGSRECQRLRKQGLLPCVAYSHGASSKTFSVNTLDFVKKASRARSSQIFFIKTTDGELNGKPALVKDIQKNYVKNQPLHVDLHVLRDDEEVTVSIPVHVNGVPFGVKNQGGVLSVSLYEVEISALPKHIPQIFNIDVTELRVGQHISAGDLGLPEGVSLLTDEEENIVSVLLPRTATDTDKAEAADGADASASAKGAAAKAPAGSKAAPAKDSGKK